MTDQLISTPTIVADRQAGDRDRLLAQLLASGSSWFPTSFAQRRQWLLHALVPGSTAYVIPMALRLRGELDCTALQAALDHVVERHEALRTTFSAAHGVPMQRIADRSPIQIQEFELPEANEERIGSALQTALSRPFDLAAGPLLRVTLWRVDPRDHILLFVVHHAVADGWSVEILLHDLGAAYRAARRGERLDAAPVLAQPAEHAVWEAGEVAAGALDADVAYWREQLRDPPEPTRLPSERPSARTATGPLGRVVNTLDPARMDRARILASELGTTAFVVLLTAYWITLARYCGQRDVVIGVPVSGRQRHELAETVGCFVNTLPVRLHAPAALTGRELIASVHSALSTGHAHERAPLDLVVGHDGPRDTSSVAPFRTVFTMQADPPVELIFEDLSVERVPVLPGHAKADLTCVPVHAAHGLDIQWDYRTDAYDVRTVAAVAETFQMVLARMVDHPDEGTEDDGLAPGTVAQDPAATAEAPSLLDLFHRSVTDHRDTVAVIDHDVCLTYAELDRRANRLAHRLRSLGVRDEIAVGICLPRGAEFAVACLATVKAGGSYVPLDPAYPEQRLRHMLKDSDTRVVVSRSGVTSEDIAFDGPVIDITDPLDTEPDNPPEVFQHRELLCMRVYTSGSTGRPKAVGVTHRGVVDLVRPGGYCGFGPDARVLWISSVSFDMATWEIWGTLLHGATGVVSGEREYDASQVRATIAAHRVTTALFSTGLFNAIADEDPATFSGVRHLLIGGEALSAAHVRAVADALPATTLVNAYGPAEITTIATCRTIDSADLGAGVIPIGGPVAGSRAVVTGPDGRAASRASFGELWLSGTGLARGYLNQPRLTAERFVPAADGQRWYRTGDRARALDGETFLYHGRLDRQVKILGYRVEPGEVESALLDRPEVARVAVVTRTAGDGSHRLVAYVVATEGHDVTGLRSDLRSVLPAYLVPATILAVPDIPLTVNGKVDEAALDPFAPAQDEIALDPPATPVESALAEIWAEAIGIPVSGLHRDADFFAIGGNSLLAASVVARVEERLGVRLPLVQVFDQPTLSLLSDAIEAVGSSVPEQRPPHSRAPRPAPLAPNQERLFFLEQLDPGTSVFHIPLVAQIDGPLDVDAFTQAVRFLSERHEVLRSRIEADGSETLQRALPIEEVPDLRLLDRRAKPDPCAVARADVAEEVRRPFDLAGGELPIRSLLVRCRDESYLACLVLHHIAGDGWSVGIIARELAAAYADLTAGRRPQLAALDAQYVDVTYAHRLRMSDGRLDDQLTYWKRSLAGAPQVLDLPTSRIRPTRRRQRGAWLRFRLDESTAAAVERLAVDGDGTPYMVLLAAFAATLADAAGKDEVLIGTPIANRAGPGAGALVGLFANTLPLRIDTGGNPTARELVRRTRAAAIGAFSHPDVPFEKLVEDVTEGRDLSRNPLVQVMFSLDNTPRSLVELSGVHAQPVDVDNPVARCDLTLALTSDARGIDGLCEYDRDLFGQNEVADLVDRFRTLLERFTTTPDDQVEDLVAETGCSLDGPAPAPTDDDLIALINRRCRTESRSPAVTAADGTTWSGADLFERIERRTAELARVGVLEGSIVDLPDRSGPDLVVELLSVWGCRASGRYGDAHPTVLGSAGSEPRTSNTDRSGARVAIWQTVRTADGHRTCVATTFGALDRSFAGIRETTSWWGTGQVFGVFQGPAATAPVLDLLGPLASGSHLVFLDPDTMPGRDGPVPNTLRADGPTWTHVLSTGWRPPVGCRLLHPVGEPAPALDALADAGADVWAYLHEPELGYIALGRRQCVETPKLDRVMLPGARLVVEGPSGGVLAAMRTGELRVAADHLVPSRSEPGRLQHGERGTTLCSGRYAHVDHAGRVRLGRDLPSRARGDTAGPDEPAVMPRRPSGATESAVAKIWTDLLEPAIGANGQIEDVHADFFALGGQSFLAARLASRLARFFGIELSVREVFEYPTVAGLAGLVETRRAEPAAPASSRATAAAAPITPVTPMPAMLASQRNDGPLTPAQERLWFLSQFAPESPAYNIPLIGWLDGPLDSAAFGRALEWVLRRHEVLRTRFRSTADGPWQEVWPLDNSPLVEEIDLSNAPDAQGEALAAAEGSAWRPFDLASGDLPVRVVLVHAAPELHIVAVTLHHLVADGWAVGLVVLDLCSAYAAYRGGTEPLSTAPPARWIDYARWTRDQDRSIAIEHDLEHWRSVLAGAPQVLDLPSSHPRPAVRRHRGQSLPFSIPPTLTRRLRGLAVDAGCTEFMALLGGFATVLSRYSASPDLLIGSPVAGRYDPTAEAMVGLLANTVVLRSDLRRVTSVRDLLHASRDTCLDAFEHQDMPFERLVEELATQRDPSRSPIFQVMLALNNAPAPSLDLPGLTCRPIVTQNPTAKFDIVLNLADHDDSINGFCEFDVDVYDAPMIEQLLRHLTAVLEAFVEDPDRRVADIELLSELERRELLADFNRVESTYGPHRTLVSLVEDAVDRSPSSTAVVEARTGSRLTYDQLDRAANRTANALLAAGVDGGVVGVHAARSIDLVVAELAVLKAGAAFLPIDPDWPTERSNAILTDSRCRFVVHGAERPAVLPEGITPLPVEATTTGEVADRTRAAIPIDPAAPAYVIYTSGSTGRPKGVIVPHTGIVNNLLWMQQDWPLGTADRMLQKTAATFDVSVKEIFWPLLAGGQLVLAEPGTQRDPDALLRQLDEHDITITHFVPSVLDLVLDAAERGRRTVGASLRFVMCGAETLSVSTQRRYAERCAADLLHMYGPTETSIAVTGWTCRHTDDIHRSRVPLGVPMPNCSLYVLDDAMRATPRGAVGQLHVGGDPVALGYLGRPAETAAVFVPDPYGTEPGARMYRTGDDVRLSADGLLEFAGRRDEQVKIRGYRVELGELEATLRSVRGVRQAVAARAGTSQSDAYLAAYVVLDGTSPLLSVEDIRSELGNRLPQHMVPARVTLLDQLPLNENGKVDRARLPAPGEAPRQVDRPFIAPRDEVERTVARVWSEVLCLERVGAEDDFFELGGHSLQVVAVAARLREVCGAEIALRDVFASPTVAEVAELVRRSSSGPPTVRIPSRRGRNPTQPEPVTPSATARRQS